MYEEPTLITACRQSKFMSKDRGKFSKRVVIPAEASFTIPDDLNKKLDEILKAISNLTERIDVIDKRFDNLESRLDEFERTVNNKISNIENQLKMKAEKNSLQKMMVRLEKLEVSRNVQEIAKVMQESYEKRFNFLIHGIAETTDSAWENPGETTALVRTFTKEGLLIIIIIIKGRWCQRRLTRFNPHWHIV